MLDGVDAFVDGGPSVGTRVQAGVILAGSDRVAIDAAGVAILRLLGTTPEVSRGLIFEQEQIARAVELGLGVNSPDQIQLVTDDAESEAYVVEDDKQGTEQNRKDAISKASKRLAEKIYNRLTEDF